MQEIDASEATRPSKKILVVDDDAALVNLLRESLIEAGHDVICGFDGQMAIQMARQHHPDLIIMDVAMPMTNGLRAFEFLRGVEDTRQIPVIFVSGELSKNVYPLIAQAPRVAHLKKPMDLEHLNSMVQEFLVRYAA
ncbi:MAG TPA: response regulator [Elusimicrobiota bacterium]|nr:response regulator [Elusimicrobiota bacterium]